MVINILQNATETYDKMREGSSHKQFLSPKILSSRYKCFCPSCKTLTESTRETCVMNSGPILAIQLCRFSNQAGQLVKDETLVSST